MKKVATFSRVSTWDQHSSIENQEKVFKQWFESNKECVLYKSYVDEGISGAKGYKRIQWNQMIKEGMVGDFQIILCKSFSRFGRNQRETLEAINKLRIKGIRIIFLEDNLDSEKDFANFGLMAWLAEKEANATSERIKMIWDSFNIQGKIHTPKPPYGYYYDKEKKNYFIKEEEAKVVKDIFKLYLNGYGYNGICNILASKNVPTKRGGQWQGNTVAKMLSNEFYLGTLIQGKTRTIDATVRENRKIDPSKWYRHENNHEAIVDEETFRKVNSLMKERKRLVKENYKDKEEKRNSNKSLFSNLLVCGECSSRMYRKRRKKENYSNSYNCLDYERRGTKCGHKSNRYKEEDLKFLLKMELEDLSEENFKRLQDIKYKKEEKSLNLEQDLKQVKKIINNKIKIANELLLNYSDGLIEQELYILQNKNINKTLKSLLQQKEDIKKKIELENDKIEEKEVFQGIETVLKTPLNEWNNAILKEIIEGIILKIDGTIDIKIKYYN